MGDRWERRNPLVDQVVDVDAAVVPAPPPAPPTGTDGIGVPDDESRTGDAPDQDGREHDEGLSGDPAAEATDDDDDDDDVEETDSRFARRNPLIEKALGGD